MSFVRKIGFVALFVIIILVLRETFSVLLMILSATIISLYFQGLANIFKKFINVSHKWAMLFSILTTVIIVVGIGYLIGSRVQEQVASLQDELPTLIEQTKEKLNQYTWGQRLIEEVSGDNQEKYMQSIGRFFNSTFGVLGDIYIIFFLTIFFIADPSLYRSGIVALIPPKHKDEGNQLLDKLADSLKMWFKGMLIAMFAVSILTGIALVILDVPMAFGLAVIAGILNFIPNFGPVIAMIPAALIGLTISQTTALIIIGVYILIQFLESSIITPTVQKKLVKIPPALIIIGQLVIGSITGYLGIIMATPIVLIIMVMVNELYVKKQDKLT